MRASDRERLVSRVLEVAAEAVVLEDLEPALPHLGALFGASNAMLYRSQPDQPFTFVAGTSDCLPEYTAQFADDDPIHRALWRDTAMVLAGSHAAEWRELRGRRALADFYDRWELSWLLHVRLSRAKHLTPGHAAVVFGRTRRQADFGREERRAAEVVLPALTAVARRAGRLARQGARLATVEALLEEAHGRAILALDLDGALRWSSPRAERVIGPGMKRGSVSEALVAAARSVAAIARKPSVALAVTPRYRFRLGAAGDATLDAEAYLGRTAAGDRFVIVDLGGGGPPDLQELARRRGLTRTEAEVLSELVRGASDAEIAGRRFVSVATVRTHVTRLLAKLGVESRLKAVALALGTLALTDRAG